MNTGKSEGISGREVRGENAVFRASPSEELASRTGRRSERRWVFHCLCESVCFLVETEKKRKRERERELKE